MFEKGHKKIPGSGNKKGSKLFKTRYKEAIALVSEADSKFIEVLCSEGGLQRLAEMAKDKKTPPYILANIKFLENAMKKGDHRFLEAIKSYYLSKAPIKTDVTMGNAQVLNIEFTDEQKKKLAEEAYRDLEP